VEVAANVVAREQERRLAVKRRLPQLGRTPRNSECCVDGLLVGSSPKLAETFDVRVRACGDQQLGAESRGLGGDQLDGHAFDRHSDSPALLTLEHRHDRRKSLERFEHRSRVRRGADDGEVERGIRPAARITGHLAAERRRDLLEEGARPVQRQAFLRLRLCPPGRGRRAAAAPSAARCRARTSAGPRAQRS
jgi:hypothetical protein